MQSHWEQQARFQNQRKNYWKQKYRISLGLIVALLITNLTWAFWPKAKVSQTGMPGFASATVLVDNANSCSGTIITKDGYGLSCGHCFRGKVGGTFRVQKTNGEWSEAKLVAHDPSNELTLFKINESEVINFAPVPEQLSVVHSYDIIGYPKGKGPVHHKLSHPSSTTITDNGGKTYARWSFYVDNGAVYPGNSGSGVFADGQLVGVLSHREEPTGKYLYCTDYQTVYDFLCKNGQCPKAPPIPTTPPDLGEQAPKPFEAPDRLAKIEALLMSIESKLTSTSVKVDKLEGVDLKPVLDQLSKMDLKPVLEQVSKMDLKPLIEQVNKMDPKQLNGKLDQIIAFAKDNPEIKDQLIKNLPQIKAALEKNPELLQLAVDKGLHNPALQEVVKGAITDPSVIGALAPSLLPMLGIIGGPLGLAGGLGFFFLRKFIKNRTNSQTIDILGAIKKIGHKDPGPKPEDKGPRPECEDDPVPSKDKTIDTILLLLEEIKNQKTQVVEKPYPIYTEQPSTHTVVPETHIQQVEVDRTAEAYAWAKAKLSVTQPGASEAFFGMLDSLMSQHRSKK